ncbi:hypothetical protein BgAZ_302890 [Babesia gibsoni]|uniref:Uncharacterized protein n=1 Tax=Babesia gibsoni TaxID=33632 RepID=A0AAD8PDW5_BABGI|nr:hypothetical protein BgAZ_302890 [Babesia gibsoni]
MLQQKNRRLPYTPKRALNKLKGDVPIVETLEGTPNNEEDNSDVNIPDVIIEEYDISKEQSLTEQEHMSLINCKSYILSEDNPHEGDSKDEVSPDYVEEFEEPTQYNFLTTLKTLVNISGSMNRDDIGSISSASDSFDADNRAVTFDLIEPIRTTSYNIMKTSTRFFSYNSQDEEDTCTDETKKEDDTTEEGSKNNVEKNGEKDPATWALDNLTKWL